MAKTYKVVRKPSTDEWVVKVYNNGKYSEAETYYTNDKSDALETMKDMKKRGQKIGTHIPSGGSKVDAAEREAEDHCTDAYRGEGPKSVNACQGGVLLFRRELKKHGVTLSGTKMSGARRAKCERVEAWFDRKYGRGVITNWRKLPKKARMSITALYRKENPGCK